MTSLNPSVQILLNGTVGVSFDVVSINLQDRLWIAVQVAAPNVVFAIQLCSHRLVTSTLLWTIRQVPDSAVEERYLLLSISLGHPLVFVNANCLRHSDLSLDNILNAASQECTILHGCCGALGHMIHH